MIKDLIGRRALFAVNHKDSQAMLIRLLGRIPREQLVVIHAALGEIEWEGALELAQKQAEGAGLPFIVARAVKTFFEMVEHRFEVRPGPNSPCWPSASIRQCTSDLKRGPIPSGRMLAMADRIGVARPWYQGDHYDIALTKRALAVRYGASEITQRQLGAMVFNRRCGWPTGTLETAERIARQRRAARARACG